MSLPYLILGLLSLEPMSGYDLNKAFQQSVQHFWSTDQSQIYRALYKMEGDGWVQMETIEQQASPNKKIYHLTATGQAELRRWLSEPLPGNDIREAWLGQIFFADQVENEVVIHVLQGYIAGLQQRLATLETLAQALTSRFDLTQAPRLARFQLLTLDYGIATHQSQIAHLEMIIQKIRQFPNKTDS